jgi:iron complex outermembrane receptor protein
VGYRLIAGNTVHDILLRGNNLTDELARQHTSPLKDIAPLPGRDITLSYRLLF